MSKLLTIVQGYADGLRQEAIAKRLGVSPSTVSYHMSKVGSSQKHLLSLLRSGKSPSDIVKMLQQPALPLDLAAENRQLRAEIARLNSRGFLRKLFRR